MKHPAHTGREAEMNRAAPHVLIIGAGPTGLTLANDLARRGVPFRIVDARSNITADSKGLALSLSSRYVYRLIGLEGRVGHQANRINRLSIYWQGRRYSSIEFSHLPHDINALLTQPQSCTEAELLASLHAAGGRVEWSRRVTDIEERVDDVRVRLTLPDGSTEEVSCSYVAGCDGKHSTVRAALGARFEGSDYAMHFVLADFHLRVDWPRGQVQYHVHPDGFFILVPSGSDLWRVVVKYDGAPPDRKPCAADITDVLHRHLGSGLAEGEPVWLSRAPFYYRVADRLASRRLFLAGDAAHLFSPIGGTGMNTGIQDAVNLGWKLAFAYHGHAGSGLLATYETERLPVIRAAAAIADLSTRLIAGENWDHPVIADMAPAMVNRANLRHLLPVMHSGMGMRLELLPRQAGAGVGTFNAAFLEWVAPLLRESGDDWRHRFHCIVNLSALPGGETGRAVLARLRDSLDGAGRLRVIYLFTNDTGVPPVSPDEQAIFLTPAMLARCATMPAVQVVRPDGVTLHECGLGDDIAIGAILSPYLDQSNQSEQSNLAAGTAMEAAVS